jgi:hypothetical protein
MDLPEVCYQQVMRGHPFIGCSGFNQLIVIQNWHVKDFLLLGLEQGTLEESTQDWPPAQLGCSDLKLCETGAYWF